MQNTLEFTKNFQISVFVAFYSQLQLNHDDRYIFLVLSHLSVRFNVYSATIEEESPVCRNTSCM